jgi:hypothetical protein
MVPQVAVDIDNTDARQHALSLAEIARLSGNEKSRIKSCGARSHGKHMKSGF